MCFNSGKSDAWFGHDRAACAAQKGDWAVAKKELAGDFNPQKATSLYDMGVASYKTGDISQAAAYFKHAAQQAKKEGDRDHEKQAHFNYGNALVEQNRLVDALAAYDAVLSLDAHDERAQHNKAIVQKMLQEQEQDKQEQSNAQEKKNEQSQGQDSQQVQDNQQGEESRDSGSQQKGSDGSQDSSAKGEQSKGKSKKDDGTSEGSDGTRQSGQNSGDREQDDGQGDGSDRQQNSGSQSKRGRDDSGEASDEREQKEDAKTDTNNGLGSQNREERKKEGRHKNNEHDADQQSGVEREQGAQNAARDNQTGDEKDKREHTDPLANEQEQFSSFQDTHGSAVAQQDDGNRQDDAQQKLQGWLAQVLDEQEQRDAHLSKEMIRAQVSQKMAGHHGQNCW